MPLEAPNDMLGDLLQFILGIAVKSPYLKLAAAAAAPEAAAAALAESISLEYT